MPEQVSSHVWRPSATAGLDGPYSARPCDYTNCGKSRAEHIRPAAARGTCPCPVFDPEPGDVVCLCGHYPGRHVGDIGACKAVLP